VLTELGLNVDDATSLDALAERVKSMKSAPTLRPEEQAEIETLRSISRASALDKSLTYQRGFVEPVRQAWGDLIEDIASGMDQTPQVRAWAENLKTQHSPKNATAAWYREQIGLMNRADGIHQQRVINKIGALSEMQKQADTVAREISSSGDLFKEWQQVENQQSLQKTEREFQEASQRAFQTSHKRLAHWQIKKEDGVIDQKALAEIRENNAKFPKRQEKFRTFITNAWNSREKATEQALDFIEMSERMPEIESENVKLKQEIASLRRRIGISRKLEDAPTRPTAGTGGKALAPEKAKLSQSKNADFSSL
jgi:hypothetical protein